jgi:crotonobetainyl-CoA:carnitine CoA-transferase CaiB-like acyl-CoA transferase
MSVTGHPEAGPVRAGFMVVDMSTALTAAFAIAGALFRRAQTGRGQHIDVSMYDTALAIMAPIVCKYLNTGVEPELQGNLTPALVPTGDVFPAAEGHVQTSVLTDAHFQVMAEVLGHPEWAEDERFSSHEQRIANADAMRACLREAFKTRTALEWERRFNAAKVSCAALRSVPEALAHPQLAHRNLLMGIDPPEGLVGEVTLLNASYLTSEDGPETDRPPPEIGQHSDAILAEVGYSESEIAGLRAAGAI